MRLFHGLDRLVTSRITVGFVLFALLALLLWYGGPKLAIDGARPLESQLHRLIAIAVLAVVFLLLEVFRRWRLRRLNRSILSSLGGTGGGPGELEGIGRIREGYMMLGEALRGHGGARMRDRRHLYHQPWFLLLGEPGAGRSAALANSGLEFVLDTGHVGASSGRTRDSAGECGWWVTDDAVFVVAPGDFVARPGPAQSAEWEELLDCLKSSRRRYPLNGIVLAIPADRLTDESGVIGVADEMRRRVQEAMTRFRLVLPVYLVVTKCDRIAGFNQYFLDLDTERRAHPLGVMLPLGKPRPLFARAEGRDMFPASAAPGAAALAAFSEGFRGFVADLSAWAATRLETERKAEYRRLIFGFPQQVQALGAPLEAVVRRIFGPSRFRRDALFRGVFFTSACRSGPIADMLAEAHREAWNLTLPEPAVQVAGSSTSFFVRGLLRDVILPECTLTGHDPSVRRRSLAKIGVAFALTGTAAAALGGSLWLGSTDVERQTLAVTNVLDSHERGRTDPRHRDFIRAALRIAPLGSEARRGTSVGGVRLQEDAWTSVVRENADRLGTFAGRYMLRHPIELSESLDSAYAAAARAVVRPAVVRALGDEVVRTAEAGEDSIESLRELLALYLGLADTERFDPRALAVWAGRHARGRLPLSADAQAQVVAVVGDAFGEPLVAEPIDPAVVVVARERLRVPPGKWIHERMMAAPGARAMPDVAIESALGERVGGVYAATGDGMPAPVVRGYFSEPGFYEQFLPNAPRAIREYRSNDWLVGTGAAAVGDDRLFADLGAAYADDYITAWNEFLDGVTLPKVATMSEALRLMEALLGGDSPLDALVGLVSEHTVLPAVRGSEEKESNTLADAGETPGGAHGAIEGKAQEAMERRYGSWPGDDVMRAFAPYHALDDDRTGNLPGLAEIRNRLGALHTVMATVDGEPDPDAAAFGEIRRWVADPRDSEVGALHRVLVAQPEPLRRMLAGLSNQSTAILMHAARRHLDRRWRDTVLDECRRMIDGRYPIDRTAATPVAPDDFEAFFAADGAVDRFYRDRVEPFVDTAASAWEERAVHGYRIGLRAEALAAFRAAAVIRTAFGLDSATLGDAGFTIEPVYLDSDATTVTVETGHRTFSYRHEPPRRFRMKLAEEAVSITLADRAGTVHVGRTNAPWAWFRTFDRHRIESAGVSDQFDFTVRIGGLEAGFRISADSTVNALSASALAGFRCEERLL